LIEDPRPVVLHRINRSDEVLVREHVWLNATLQGIQVDGVSLNNVKPTVMSQRQRASIALALLAVLSGLTIGANAGPNNTGITAGEAAAIALKQVPGGTVLAVDPGLEGSRAIWEVLIRKPDNTGIEIDISASTGVALRQERESLPSEARGISPIVTIQQAITTAVAAVPGGRLIEIDLGREDGRTVWEARVAGSAGRVEISIDVTTGRILKKERDD
jgi:uncharacterized membrane protein YkoI